MEDLDKLKRHLGAVLLTARERSGLTQADVSSLVGLVPAVYGRIERGQMLPSVPTLHKICVTLNLSANALLGLGAEWELEDLLPEPQAEPAELRQLRTLLHSLSPEELRTLGALASAIAHKK
ncbi:helix-turn-helix domain-containing protein [Vitiosangium sp. GDMCC 1.1324]|uniref:helix-turn-helix domain-containing protein n=1 Tax=Vitiosangium sp. (strain GDMCC 1.1324) TaxID=2138576 RepID=UPI000D3491FA|nr:helix-turn-helix transcriptional regulator [Vitiosangium sp. GDMCC 1.1324]PTL81670.1 transcriptional regulator [Vitiosangium sp. GDMCC 1.1324]